MYLPVRLLYLLMGSNRRRISDNGFLESLPSDLERFIPLIRHSGVDLFLSCQRASKEKTTSTGAPTHSRSPRFDSGLRGASATRSASRCLFQLSHRFIFFFYFFFFSLFGPAAGQVQRAAAPNERSTARWALARPLPSTSRRIAFSFSSLLLLVLFASDHELLALSMTTVVYSFSLLLSLSIFLIFYKLSLIHLLPISFANES